MFLNRTASQEDVILKNGGLLTLCGCFCCRLADMQHQRTHPGLAFADWLEMACFNGLSAFLALPLSLLDLWSRRPLHDTTTVADSGSSWLHRSICYLRRLELTTVRVTSRHARASRACFLERLFLRAQAWYKYFRTCPKGFS